MKNKPAEFRLAKNIAISLAKSYASGWKAKNEWDGAMPPVLSAAAWARANWESFLLEAWKVTKKSKIGNRKDL